MDLPEILTIEEVAKYLRVSERTVYEWAQKGEIPAGKFGSSWRFKCSEIRRWADERLGMKDYNLPAKPLFIRDILTPERVVILKGSKKNEVLEELIKCLSTAPEVKNKDELTLAIFHRENLMSTGIGLGIAVPHVRLESVKDLVMAIGISRSGIADYESLDGQPVDIICMIAAGKYQHAKHLKALAAISACLKNESLRQLLLSASDSESIYDIMVNGGG